MSVHAIYFSTYSLFIRSQIKQTTRRATEFLIYFMLKYSVKGFRLFAMTSCNTHSLAIVLLARI